ncbi:hypothetical protein E1284_16855 [Actinomadura bangladeshensis]|uniref:Uncharacterized protein n=1 Tax=Actinomadura bangladeshensis TaxID=453573 RepID=A0A4R4P2Q0_9ACTN|nr:hypothetical protein E1284_16855 [Actinomadura bangladeshensis]
MPLGVVKGTTPLSIVATAGLCIALVPLGLAILSTGPRPIRRSAAQFGIGALAVITLAFVSSLG